MHTRGHRRTRSDVVNQAVPISKTLPPKMTPAYMRSNSSGSNKRPLSFIAGIANKVKSAFEGKQDSNRQFGSQWDFIGEEFGGYSSDSSPNTPRKPINTYPRIKKTNNRLSVPNEQQYPIRKMAVNSSNPSFDDVINILSVPSSPEFNHCRRNSRKPSDVISEQSNDVTKSSDVNILVIGSEGVGKSALIVRYLTKRFIGEYAPNVESVYDHTITIDGRETNIQVWDSAIPPMLQKFPDKAECDATKLSLPEMQLSLSMTSLASSVTSSLSSASSRHRISCSSIEEDQIVTSFQKNITIPTKEKMSPSKKKNFKTELNNNLNYNEMHLRLNWADCVVVVYSICDLESFESARDIVRYIRGQYVRGHSISDFNNADTINRLMQMPILLIGNKSDLERRRQVDLNAAENFSAEYTCNMVELSVPEGFQTVCDVFNSIIGQICIGKLPPKLTKIKSIVRTVSDSFGHRRNLSM